MQKKRKLIKFVKYKQISLNIGKIDLVPFTSPKKQPVSDLEIKLHRKSLCETNSVKYLGIQIDEISTWKWPINLVAVKLNKANAMLSKLRNFQDKKKKSQSSVQYLSPIYDMLFLFECKTQFK